MAFERDPEHWLFRLTPEEWMRAGMGELARAQAAFAVRNAPSAYAGLKRAAGMALNAALIVAPNEAWGRTYVQHLTALAADESAPEEVRRAATVLCDANVAAGSVIMLRTRSDEQKLLEAARTVMAHAYALVHGKAGRKLGEQS